MIWEAMTHSLQEEKKKEEEGEEEAEFRLALQPANKSSASVELALPRKQIFS